MICECYYQVVHNSGENSGLKIAKIVVINSQVGIKALWKELDILGTECKGRRKGDFGEVSRNSLTEKVEQAKKIKKRIAREIIESQKDMWHEHSGKQEFQKGGSRQ